jgi:hypothetical protein
MDDFKELRHWVSKLSAASDPHEVARIVPSLSLHAASDATALLRALDDLKQQLEDAERQHDITRGDMERTRIVRDEALAQVEALTAERDSLKTELEEAKEINEYVKERRAQISQRLWQWAHEELSEPLKTRYFNIVANGVADVMEQPTYAQQFNVMKSRAIKAEAERDNLRHLLGCNTAASWAEVAEKLVADRNALMAERDSLRASRDAALNACEKSRELLTVDRTSLVECHRLRDVRIESPIEHGLCLVDGESWLERDDYELVCQYDTATGLIDAAMKEAPNV